MASNAETQALLEKALHHVLAEQSRVLLHTKSSLMIREAKELGDLASATWKLLSQGMHKVRCIDSLIAQARNIENAIDDITQANWFYLDISVSTIYERTAESFALRPVEKELGLKAAILVRNHFHNLRILLLEQLLGARMLINNNDYGTECERVWQQFFQRELGPDFRVLHGGHIIDYAGNDANAQIDLVVVSADAHVITPSGSDGGKVNVLCDQVIAAIMTTSNLHPSKLREDWLKLERISGLFKFTDDFPEGKEQAWPLCYVIASQSVPLPKLVDQWLETVKESAESKFIPQFIIALDSGYLYSGATSWPRPRYPRNYVNRDQVVKEEGIYAGLGIAWMVTQIRARAKLLQNKNHRTIARFTKLLDDATLKSATPATWSPRFDTFGSTRPIEGVFHWGSISQWIHNRLFLCSLAKATPDNPEAFAHIVADGADVTKIPFHELHNHLRWFSHETQRSEGGILVFQEWKKHSDAAGAYSRSDAVFDANTGEEFPSVSAWDGKEISDLKCLIEISPTSRE